MKLKNSPSDSDIPENVQLTPQDIVFSVFGHLEKDELSMQEIVPLILVGGCPNAQMAQNLLANMCNAYQLTWRKDEQGNILFKRVVN